MRKGLKPLDEEFGVGAVEGDAHLLGVLDLLVVEVPGDLHLALFDLLLQATLQLDVLALVLDLEWNEKMASFRRVRKPQLLLELW